MKLFQAGIHFDNENSKVLGALFLPSPPGKRETNGIYWSVLTALMAMALCACGDSGAAAKEQTQLPVNDTVVVKPAANGIPPDIAKFFAATKIDSKCPNDTTCVYLQTFLDGATREITLRVSPGKKFVPPPGESAAGTPGSIPISGFTFASRGDADSTITIDMNYYVAKGGLPNGPAKTGQAPSLKSEPGGVALVRLAALRTNEPWGNAPMQLAANTDESGGAGIYWGEVGKKTADWAIGAGMDLAKAKGVKAAGPIGTVYTLASALSDVAEGSALSEQHKKWSNELDSLEECAANPTNQVAKSDPNYSKNTVAKIRSARGELTEVTGVRFLNKMTEKGADLTPVTAVMAIGLKQGFAWSEQTLDDYSKNTIMREAELAVVACEGPEPLKGNLDVTWEWTLPLGRGATEHEIRHLVADVSWVVHRSSPPEYVSQGTYTYSMIRTALKCTTKGSAKGSVTNKGVISVIENVDNPYHYVAQGVVDQEVTYTTNCVGPGKIIDAIDWLPHIEGIPGTGGSIAGVQTKEIPGGTVIIKYDFALPPAK